MQSSVYQMGERRGEQKAVARLYEMRLGRPLEDAERAILIERLGALGYDRLAKVVFDLSSDALAEWLRNAAAA